MSQQDLQMQLFPFQESAVSIEVHVYEEIHTVGFIKNATIWKNVTLALSREPELRSYTRLLNMGVV